jgi:uncharacterized protein involved in exopolysaccharide biosynthesis
MAPHSLGTSEPELRLDLLFRPFIRRWRLVAGSVALSWLMGLAIIFIPPRRYEASEVLAAMPNTRGVSLAGGLSALLGTGQLGGVQSTPYFVTKLLLLRGVVTSVAMSRVSGSDQLVIERIARKPIAAIKPADIEKRMRKILDAQVDKQTGLITFTVTHRDSALARQIANQVVAAASQTYTDVVRAQATSQRLAQETRVDSAQRQLRNAEGQFVDFLSSNRSYATYSGAAVLRQRIERQLNNAQTVYSQAVTDREAAIARELEATPALVIVDPLPKRLLAEPLQAPLKMTLATLLGLMMAGLVLLVRGEFTAPPPRETTPKPTPGPHSGVSPGYTADL